MLWEEIVIPEGELPLLPADTLASIQAHSYGCATTRSENPDIRQRINTKYIAINVENDMG